MQDAQPSRTAMRVAIRRAAHQVLDERPLVLDDPVAIRIIEPNAASALTTQPKRQQRPAARASRAFMISRSRFAEDALARAVERGTRQYVVLGAGLDTFAYRNPYPGDTLRVFEVDHPATQAWKRRKLAAAGITPPPTLSFVPVNFERESLAERLADAGLNRHLPVFFSWLGVTMYLTDEAFAGTLAFIAGCAAGGGVAFDYGVVRSRLRWRDRLVVAWLSWRVSKAGEPFRSFFDPPVLSERLRQAGFTAIEDLGPAEINARYFAARTDGLRVVGGFGRFTSGERR